MAYFSKTIFFEVLFDFFAWFSAHIHHPNTHTFNLACRPCFDQTQLGLPDWEARRKTYNSWDSLVVTHPTINQPACGLNAVSSLGLLTVESLLHSIRYFN